MYFDRRDSSFQHAWGRMFYLIWEISIFFSLTFVVPGHGSILQVWNSMSFPSHHVLPEAQLAFEHLLSRYRVPCPQI